MRRIFSTVRQPHEPAFTVESLAITHTGRPSMRPVPVTTPSAGRSPARLFAKAASSTNESGSSSRARRSRQKSLPSSRAFSWYFGSPPWRIRARRSRTSSPVFTAPPARAGAVRVSRFPLASGSPRGRPAALQGAVHAARKRPLQHLLLEPRRRVDERVEVHAGRDARAREQVHDVLARDVARRARRVGAAAEPAERGVEGPHAGLEARLH